MLAEKFLLMLETLISSQRKNHPNGSPKVFTTSRHVPIQHRPKGREWI